MANNFLNNLTNKAKEWSNQLVDSIGSFLSGKATQEALDKKKGGTSEGKNTGSANTPSTNNKKQVDPVVKQVTEIKKEAKKEAKKEVKSDGASGVGGGLGSGAVDLNNLSTNLVNAPFADKAAYNEYNGITGTNPNTQITGGESKGPGLSITPVSIGGSGVAPAPANNRIQYTYAGIDDYLKNGGASNSGKTSGGGTTKKSVSESVTPPFTVDDDGTHRPQPDIRDYIPIGNNDSLLGYLENTNIPDFAADVRAQAAGYLPTSYQYDYDWMKDQITQDIDNANNYLAKYTDQLINRASDANADNLYNLLKTLRKNRASGLTSDANTGYNAATDLASIIAANQAGNETLQSLANTGQDAAYNLYARLADATNNANSNLNAWGNTQVDYGSNVMGNYLYNALGSLLNMYGTKYNADSVANSAARELAETIANNNSYWNYVNKK